MSAAVFTALITAGGVLIATWLSNRHNRGLKLIEIREQTALTLRQEKREVYLEVLRANRLSVQYVIQLSHMDLGEQLRVDTDAIDAASERFRKLIPELEIVGSSEVYDLSQELYAGVSRCNAAMYRESEQRFSAYDRAGEQPTPEQGEAIWEEVRTEVQKVYEGLDMEGLYGRLRNQIRRELGFLALEPDLVPTPEETRKLREELANLDQLRKETP